MLNVMQSFYKPFCLTLLAVLGLACGHLIDTVLQKKLRPDFSSESTDSYPTTTKPLKTTQTDLNVILKNNIFDAKNRFADASMTLEVAAARTPEAPTMYAQADLKLIGTVVGAERSHALLKVNKEQKIYHIGDKILGDGSIEDIRRNQVEIRNRDQSLTTLTLQKNGPTPSSGVKSAARVTGDSKGAVREIGENRWMISRSTIESVRENFADQLRLAHMQPRTVGGKTDGFLIQRINPRSLLVKVGLRRGDVIIDVNNIKLDSPEKALQVFQQLREARQITVAVERNGKPMNFEYEFE
jgi:general secretion pathway protein C